jgi:hypothetical protein
MLLAQSADDIEQEYANGFRSLETEPIDRSFSRLMAKSKVEYLSLLNLLCNPQCKVLVSRAPLEFDSGHLTGEGSTYLTPFILKSYGGHSENAVPNREKMISELALPARLQSLRRMASISVNVELGPFRDSDQLPQAPN